MGIKEFFLRSPLANYGKTIRTAPKEIILNRSLIFSSILYAMCALPASKSISSSYPYSLLNLLRSMGSRLILRRTFVTRLPASIPHNFGSKSKGDKEFHLSCLHWICHRSYFIILHQRPHWSVVVFPPLFYDLDHWTACCQLFA